MKEIPVGKNHVALVDDEDYTDLIQFSWNITDTSNSRTAYAIRNLPSESDGRHRTEAMHQRITGYERTDHRDGNGLNNCRSNLRLSTRSENQANARKRSGVYTSPYKGVTWHKASKMWRAQIVVNRRNYSLGYYTDEVEAAKAYDRAALHYFKEFAYCNFRDEPQDRPLRTDPPDETPED